MSTEVEQSPVTAMSRPQIGIDRLPTRRVSNEPREAMNCKSCRKRKIKCNRTRPTCEACQVFNCACIYDAVPKKRGPKTDVLEALLKRVDGLEKRLHTEGKSDATDDPEADHGSLAADESSSGGANMPDSNHHAAAAAASTANNRNASVSASTSATASHGGGGGGGSAAGGRPTLEIVPNRAGTAKQLMSPVEPSLQTPSMIPFESLLDTYFARLHGKPYFILDEAATRQNLQANQLPSYLALAIYAVSARYTPQFGGYNTAVRYGHDYARRARQEIDIDEPSIEALQALMLLSQASFQMGKGKKTYMLLTSAISMAFALDLHRELPLALKVSQGEREGRRRLFWSCYLMDRFAAAGSKRPSLISDESIVLRLPSWQMHPGGMLLEGDYFSNGSNLQYMVGAGKAGHGGMGMLIGISKILGITNRYLAAGGVKGDSHFPWHSLSNLSKIRQELDIWASETQDTFTSLEALFGQPDSTILVLSKLVYHLIHCLIYRPFLPVDLAELSGTSQHQSWQIEATNMCFLHANAIAELVEIGRASSIIDWPAFVGYCVCTAGTIHVHGAHYRGREGEVFSVSPEFLSREMHQLSDLRFIWAGIQHQRDTLQNIYGRHSEFVKSLGTNPMRFSPVFQLEDFFDRYPGQKFDGAHVTFQEIQVEGVHESIASYSIDRQNGSMYMNNMVASQPLYHQQPPTLPSSSTTHGTGGPPAKKRRATTSSASRPSVQHVAPPIPTPTSATHPPISMVIGPSVTNQDPKDNRTHSPTNLRPFTPPSANSTANNVLHHSLGGLHLPFSPNFSFSPLPQISSLAPTPTPAHAHPHHPSAPAAPSAHQTNDNKPSFDPALNMPTPYDHPTPGGASTSGSVHTDPDKDPFLSLLEQLAENEVSRGGPSELDFFLSGRST